MKKHGTARQPTDGSIMRRMHFACWTIWARIDTDSLYFILIAFPWQQWLRERASILPYTVLSMEGLILQQKSGNVRKM